MATFVMLTVFQTKAQNKKETYKQPKLVVGIVVDQMRYDYLPRFWNKYGEGGFKRLVNDGFNCKNNHYNYVPTYTGPGHTSVYTGTTPEFHGIIANDWFDKNINEYVYCAQDDNVLSVGTKDNAGKMSPSRMLTTTVTDQLKLATQQRGKVIGVSLKDRGAILPAGHAANAAYWFHGKDEGRWITSSYYMNQLPKWVKKFNDSKIAISYKKEWDTYYDIKEYNESGVDDNNFEGKFTGEKTPTFPHDLKKLWLANKGFDLLKSTPYGNSLTADFAMEAIKNEEMGKDDDTDFLALSFSATDYVGHKFGVNSKEVEDTYIRLDKDLERLLSFLDTQVGKGQYTVFLTADHAAVQVPSYLESVKIPGGYFDYKGVKEELDSVLNAKFHIEGLVKNISNNQIFLDEDALKNNGSLITEVENATADFVATIPHIFQVYTATEMKDNNYTQGFGYVLQKGYNHQRSGNVLVVLDPAYISYPKTGSTHGTGFNYDTHVPLLFYGFGINQGSTVGRTEITDIAPTISSLLGIAFPNGATGSPIEKVLE